MSKSARKHMIEAQIARRGICDRNILAAMAAVPREDFVEPGFEKYAYDDRALPIAEGQTISQPYIVAVMLDAARLGCDDRVLEVGTGSGYSAAILSRLVAEVFAIERHANLTETARARCRILGYHNIHFRTGDGTRGWLEAAPFEAILTTAAAPEPPASLKQQLALGGRLIIPIGENPEQRLIRVTRRDAINFEREDLGGVHFVPLIGAEGWSEAASDRHKP